MMGKKFNTGLVILFISLISIFFIGSPFLPANAANEERKDHKFWLLESPIFNRIPATAQEFFLKHYDLIPSDLAPTTDSETYSTDLAERDLLMSHAGELADNIRINDPKQDPPPGVQNQTASAAFEDTIVVVYNHVSDFRVRASYTNDGGNTWKESIVSSLPRGANVGDGMITVDPAGNFFVSTMAINSFSDTVIAVSKSVDGGATWRPAADATTTDVKPRNFHMRPWIAADSTSSRFRGSVYVSWTKLDNIDNRSTIMFSSSTDGGSKFSEPIQITPDAKGFNLDGSRLAVGPAGEVYATWFDESNDSINIAVSTDGGLTFSKSSRVVAFGSQRAPRLLNGHFAINDFPSIAVDLSDGKTRGRVYITYNARRNATLIDRSDVLLVSSNDGGRTWSEPVKVNDDETDTDQWMPSVAVTITGKVAVFWYDRRNDIGNNALIDLYMAGSLDGGKSFLPNVRVSNSNWAIVPTPTTLAFGYHGEYNQISTRGELINFNWGDDRNGTDPNVFFATLPVDTAIADDFILNGRTLAGESRAGGEISLQIDSKRVKGFSDNIQLSAESTLPKAEFDFSSDNISAGNSFQLKVVVPPNTAAGTYPIIVSGRSGEKVRSTTVQVVVLGTSSLIKPRQRLTQTPGDSSNPRIVTDARGVAHMVFQDDTPGVSQIFYARSLDGESFSAPINISGSTDPSSKPELTVDAAGGVHVIWEARQSTGSIIFYARSDDGGLSFTPRRIVSNGVDIAFDAAIAAGPNNTVNLIWTGRQNAGREISSIFLARSTDGGQSFSTPKAVQSSLETQQVFFEPAIATDIAGVIHIASSIMLVKGRSFNVPTFTASLFYLRSLDGGETFSEPLNIVSDFNFTDSPYLVVGSNSTLLVLFAGFNNSLPFASREIYLARSFDNGISFSLNTLFFGNGDSSNVSASLDSSGDVSLVWRDTQTRNSDIFMSRFSVSEQAFTGALNLSQNLGISENPTIAADRSGNLLIAWEDETAGNNEILFTRLTSADLRLPTITGVSPLEAAPGDKVTVTGKNFLNIIDVRVGRFSVRIEENSEESLTFSVPNGITTGPVLIVTKTGLVRSTEDLIITGKVAATPTRIDFGPVSIDNSSTRMVKVINASSFERKITAVVSDNPVFSLASTTLPITLKPGANIELPLVFKPKDPSFQTARIVIVSDDKSPSPLTIALSGSGNDSQPPTVEIKRAPEENEKIHFGDKFVIVWDVQEQGALALQEILLSIDDGATFPISIASGLRSQRAFEWTVPKIDARKARIRIIAADAAGNRGQATSVSFRISKKKRR
jgi:hypothetical protein